MNVAFKPSVSKLSESAKLDEVLNYCKNELLNSESPNFLYKPILDELNSPGSSSWNTSKGVNEYFQDKGYYLMAHNLLSKSGYLIGENIEKLPTNGKVEMSKICSNKFGENKLPWEVIRYCMERVRQVVSKEYKFQEEELESIFAQPQGEAKESENSAGVMFNLYIDDKPSQVLPDLKKLLIDCGGRDVKLTTKGFTPEILAKLKPVADKKRKAFSIWIKKLFTRFTEAVKQITPEQVKEAIEKKGIESGSSYVEGDQVVYLKKDKTIEDWKKLSEDDKSNLESETTKEVVSQGKITSIKDDNVEIDYADGKKTIKTKSEIIKKVETK